MKNVIALFLLVGSPLGASQLEVNMFFLGETNLGFFTFSVNGVNQQLLCDQFLPNVTTLMYTSKVATLADLANTQLVANSDPVALLKYEQVAILDLQAYADPTLAADVVRAARIIVDGSGPNPPKTQQLLDFARAQNPANYDLTSFRIYTSPLTTTGDRLTQEMTGFPVPVGITGSPVPEPSSTVLLLIGFGVLFGATVLKKRKRQSKRLLTLELPVVTTRDKNETHLRARSKRVAR